MSNLFFLKDTSIFSCNCILNVIIVSELGNKSNIKYNWGLQKSRFAKRGLQKQQICKKRPAKQKVWEPLCRGQANDNLPQKQKSTRSQSTQVKENLYALFVSSECYSFNLADVCPGRSSKLSKAFLQLWKGA